MDSLVDLRYHLEILRLTTEIALARTQRDAALIDASLERRRAERYAEELVVVLREKREAEDRAAAAEAMVASIAYAPSGGLH